MIARGDVTLLMIFGGQTTVIGLASTLMVLDHSVGSSRRPRVVGTDHDRPIGYSLLILQSRSPYIPNKYIG